MKTRIVFFMSLIVMVAACKFTNKDQSDLAEGEGEGVGKGIERHMSEDARTFRNEFVAMKTEDDVDRLLNKMT